MISVIIGQTAILLIIMVIGIFLYRHGLNTLRQVQSEKRNDIENYINDSLQSLTESISPRVIYCASIQDVRDPTPITVGVGEDRGTIHRRTHATDQAERHAQRVSERMP